MSVWRERTGYASVGHRVRSSGWVSRWQSRAQGHSSPPSCTGWPWRALVRVGLPILVSRDSCLQSGHGGGWGRGMGTCGLEKDGQLEGHGGERLPMLLPQTAVT